MADTATPNGSKTPQSGQHTPRRNTLSLTEYAANPSPSEDAKAKASVAGVPPDFLLPSGYPDYLRLVLTSKVYDVIERTPLTLASNLSNRLESQVFLKREDLLPVFSFKLRGAYNKMAHLPTEDRWKGVIACSAGNHAQGVAYSARKLTIPATILMPTGTPAIKHTNVARLGGNVILHGADFDEAKAECTRLAGVHGLTVIPPFDDPYVIAGQGTIGLEITQQCDLSKLEAIFCCVGGGGLIAGVGVFIKRIAPHVKIVGVEAYDANAMVQSLEQGRRVVLKEVGLFADGAAVKTVGEETFRICSEVVDEVVQVDTDGICAAIKDTFEDTRAILEPAGALALAGLKKWVAQNPSPDGSRQLVAIASGANMNFDRLRFVAERAALGERREALLAVRIPEHPGSSVRLIEAIDRMSVTEFCYRFDGSAEANILIGINVRPAHRERDLRDLVARLDRQGMAAADLSDNELAKSHIRYLVGGRSPAAARGDAAGDERLFAFEFPERQGALQRFLTMLQPGVNISLFHYRNTGGDIGKVLTGIQCPPGREGELEQFLRELGYGWSEVTADPAYRMFMRG